jgi:predicted RNA polymerase sigma factor
LELLRSASWSACDAEKVAAITRCHGQSVVAVDKVRGPAAALAMISRLRRDYFHFFGVKEAPKATLR